MNYFLGRLILAFHAHYSCRFSLKNTCFGLLRASTGIFQTKSGHRTLATLQSRGAGFMASGTSLSTPYILYRQ
jgi:hypothetical protein